MFALVLAMSVVVLPDISGGALFAAGDAAQRAALYENAAKLFAECAADSEMLRPYALSRVAKNHLLSGDRAEAERLFTQLLGQYPKGPWARLTQARLGELYLDVNAHEQAREQLNAVICDVDPTPWFLDGLALRRAQNALAMPEHAGEGYAYFRRVAATTLYVVQRREAARRLLASPNIEDRAWGVYGYVRAGNLREAREAMTAETIVLRGPADRQTPLSALDLFFTGEESEVADAVKRLESLIQNHTDVFWVRIWLMLAAREQAGAKRYAAAEALAVLLARYFPDGRDAGDVYWWLSERYESEAGKADARRMYRLLADTCPDHVRAPRSLFYLATYAREQGLPEEAYALFDALGEAHPASRFAAEGFYRCAQLAAAQGDDAREQHYLGRAIGVGPGEFYAHRALHRLRQALDIRPADGRSLRIDGADDFIQPFPRLPDAQYAPHPLLMKTDMYKRLKFFGIHGLEEGEWEALHTILTTPNALEKQWYPVIADAGFMHTLMQFVSAREWGVEAGKPTAMRLRVAFPAAYWPKIYAISRELGLDPWLLLAIAKQESTFRAAVLSRAGATGVLQLMPATARWLADVDERITREHVAHLKSPFNSIRLGAVYLHRMINRSQGHLVYALASYNAGPGNCDKWRARFANYKLEDFIEAIPFSETNDYVKKVLANYAAYHSIYPQPDAYNRLVASGAEH